MTEHHDTTTTGGDDPHEFDDFTEEERASLTRWRRICSHRPPMTQERIESVAALFRRMDERARAEASRPTTR